MDKHKISAWLFYLGLFLLFAAGLALMILGHKYRSDYSIAEILELLGHAFVVAAILAATVDLFVKERLLKEASRDIAKYLIGYELPKEMQDRIKELMGTKLIRRDVHILFKMKQSPESSDKFVVEVEYRHKVENLTNQQQEYLHEMSFPKHTNPKILEMRCDSADEGANYYHSGEFD